MGPRLGEPDSGSPARGARLQGTALMRAGPRGIVSRPSGGLIAGASG